MQRGECGDKLTPDGHQMGVGCVRDRGSSGGRCRTQYVQPGGESASWRGRGGGGDVWRENPSPLKCCTRPLIKVHGTLPWQNPGRPSRACISQRGERKQSDFDDGRMIKGRNLSQSESGGKAWGHHIGCFPEGGGPLYSVSHRQARRELWEGGQRAWRALRDTRLPAHPPPPRSVPHRWPETVPEMPRLALRSGCSPAGLLHVLQPLLLSTSSQARSSPT